MAKEIEIRMRSHGRSEGMITFDETPVHLNAERTADGFKLKIPIKLGFYLVPDGEPIPMLSNLHGTVLVGNSTGGLKMQIGRIYNDSWFTASGRRQGEESSLPQRDETLTWQGSLADLAVFEKFRDVRVPQLEIDLRGEFCYLLPGVKSDFRVRTEPQSFFARNGSIQVTYPREVWVKMLQGLGVAENVLVEVPLPGSPPAPWDEVWRSLVEARNAFEYGGSHGWKACVTAVRVALEKWRAIEQEDMGPGWKNTPGRPEERSKDQRLDNLRWHLHHCTHYWVHNPAEKCTRDDALLMLSTLSALLAERQS